jgi:hypothetical protein
MGRNHFSPKLDKHCILRHCILGNTDYTVYAVDAFAIRNAAKPDEEFGNFATNDEFPDLIPKGEIWISRKLAPKEGIFFMVNALTIRKRLADGVSFDKAYEQGLEMEQSLRERLNGIKYRDGQPHQRVPPAIYLKLYQTIPDRHGSVKVWLVDGNLVRSYYKTDYTEGGHGYVYPWVPQSEIWVEDGVDHAELPYITAHEYLERRLMRDAHLGYDRAHLICSTVEFDLRKNRPVTRFLAAGPRKIQKTDLSRLASPELFNYVRKHYVKRRAV